MKISKKYFLFVFLVAAFINDISAQQPMKDPQTFRAKFSEASKKISSIESSFIQEKNISVISEVIKTKGKFYFRKENKLRWEYTSPFSYIFILNNGKAYIKDEGKQNTFDIKSNKMFSEVNSILIGSVQGTLLEDEKRFSSSYFENPANYIVKLKPRSSKLSGYLSEIILTLDKNDYSVVKLEMKEPSGDYTKIDFTGKKLNTLQNDEKFIIP